MFRLISLVLFMKSTEVQHHTLMAFSPRYECSRPARVPLSDVMFRKSTFPGPAGWREASERPYSCDICSKRYSQRQGVSRHRRKAHNNPHPCCVLHCEFKWTRPDLYRAHLKNRHSDVNPDKVLGKPAGSRRRSTIIGRDLPQGFPRPPDRRSQAELRQHPMTSPLPPVAEVTHVPTLPMSPVGYNSQHECAEPAITTRKHEDGWGLDLFGATAPSAFLPIEERAQAVNDLDVSIHVDRI